MSEYESNSPPPAAVSDAAALTAKVEDLSQMDPAFPEKETLQKKNKSNKEPKKEIPTPTEVLVSLAIGMAFFFKDFAGIAYAQVNVNGRKDTLPVASTRSENYLSKLYHDNCNNKIAGSETIKGAIRYLQAYAAYECPTIEPQLRVAWGRKGEEIFYDLANEDGESVAVSVDGWQITSYPDVAFIRYNQKPQVIPSKHYSPDTFGDFLDLTNIKDPSHKLLVQVFIVTCFVPAISHPILLLYGEKGSAKSTLLTLIKELTDPAKPTLLTIPRDKDEFIQQLSHNPVAFYDNVKHVPAWLSDEACKAATGNGHTKRRLYTNDEDFVYEYRRILSFNGINLSLTDSDVLDRSIMIELTRIPRDKRRVESEIVAAFEELRPRLLGYIFDVLAKALRIKPSVKLGDIPRMTEFAVWGEAVARAMGHGPGEFIKAYFENIGRQNIDAVDAHPLGQAAAKFADDLEPVATLVVGQEEQREWIGTASDLLERLDEIADKHRINKNQREWPKSASALSMRLNEIKSNLLEGLGIEVTIGRDNKTNKSSIKVRKLPPKPPDAPEEGGQMGNPNDRPTGGVSMTGGSMPPAYNAPPENQPTNDAQNHDVGDTGGDGGVIAAKDSESSPIREGALSEFDPLIGKAGEFYYCRLHPGTFKNIHKESIIHHCQNSEFELHKQEAARLRERGGDKP